MDLKGRAALITGGAKIGQAVAEALARGGCDVAVTYLRSKEKAELTAKSVRSSGARAVAVQADVRREADLDRTLAEVEKAFGRLDILVNMASVYKKSSLQELSAPAGGGGRGEDLWRVTLDTDLESAYRLSLKAAPLLRRHGAGRILNFSDWLAASGRPRYREYMPYYVAKAGVKGLTEILALELAPEILVNAIAPGPIEGPPGLTEEENREVLKQTPLGRWGGASEIARAALFLIETDFVTGECLRVDGGRHLF